MLIIDAYYDVAALTLMDTVIILDDATTPKFNLYTVTLKVKISIRKHNLFDDVVYNIPYCRARPQYQLYKSSEDILHIIHGASVNSGFYYFVCPKIVK